MHALQLDSEGQVDMSCRGVLLFLLRLQNTVETSGSPTVNVRACSVMMVTADQHDHAHHAFAPGSLSNGMYTCGCLSLYAKHPAKYRALCGQRYRTTRASGEY